MNIIEMTNIRKDYPLGETVVHALRGVDLYVKRAGFSDRQPAWENHPG